MRILARPLKALLLAAALNLGTGPAAAEILAPLPQPEPMPAFSLPGLNGSSFGDADLRNKVTIIRFWASW